MKILTCILSFALILGINALGYATLWDRGGGMIYDDVLNITWLQDANYAQTSGYNSTGRMSYVEALQWVGNLVYNDLDDWRLPTGGDLGTREGELYNLTWNNLSYEIQCGGWCYGNLNSSPFINIAGPYWFVQNENWYPVPRMYQWGEGWYDLGDPRSTTDSLGWDLHYFSVLPVRDGDVASVPEPGTMLLLGIGLLGLAGIRKKFRN